MNHRSPQTLSSTRTSRGQRRSGLYGNTKGVARHSPMRSPLRRGGDVDSEALYYFTDMRWPWQSGAPVKEV
jgi:hypothetical protein